MGTAKTVPAHDQTASNHYTEHYPDHAPREHDPHKHLFDAYHRAHKDTAVCWVGERIGFEHCAPRPMELHHAVIEEAVQNETLWAAISKDFPAVHDEESLLEWVNGGAGTENFRWLCSVADTPVLMADGSERAISSLSPGDVTATGLVTAVGGRHYSGTVVDLTDRLTLTADHRVWTPSGWVPAVAVTEMLRVRGIENEVLRAVVGSVPVGVVDSLGSLERSADHLFHDPAMLHHVAALGRVPHPNVALGGYFPGGRTGGLPRTLGSLPGHDRHSARVGTVASVASGYAARGKVSEEGLPAVLARHLRGRGLLPRTERVPALGRRTFFRGYVHDITIATTRAFLSDSIVVHNCSWHHRSVNAGAHHVSHSDWEAGAYSPEFLDQYDETRKA